MTHLTPETTTTQPQDALHLALELSSKQWKLAFLRKTGRPRIRTIAAGHVDPLLAEIDKAKRLFGLAPDAPVYSCCEAGRDGFWVHRLLEKMGIQNVVVDPASIEVERRRRKRKTDRLEATKLVSRLVRYWQGESGVWAVVAVITPQKEDARRPQRERERLRRERQQHGARILSLLATQGPKVNKTADGIYLDWRGEPLAEHLRAEISREEKRLELVNDQLRELNQVRKEQESGDTKAAMMITSLKELKGIGDISSWVLVMEVFSWRPYTNRRQAGSLVGLTGTPHDSGGTQREQGISKAGNPRVRALLVELAWLWLRYQPQSELSLWYQRRWASMPRGRRVGIVAVARKLFIALWRMAAFGEIPAGAQLKSEQG